MNGSNDNGGNSSNTSDKLRGDFDAFEGLWERRPWAWIESLPRMGHRSVPAIAIAGLSYIGGAIAKAGGKPTLVALLIAAIAVTVFLVETLNNAKTNKNPLAEPTEPTDDRQRSQAAGKTPGRD